MAPPTLRPVQKVLAYLLAWTAAGLFFVSQDLTRRVVFPDPNPWWHALVSWMTGMYLCAALTPAILWLGRRFPLERRVWLRRTLLHLAASVTFSIVHLTLDSALLPHLGIFPTVMKDFVTTFVLLVILGFHGNIMTYWLVLGIQATLRTYRQYQERKEQALRLELQATELQGRLVQARLTALKGQLQPHFLFNTLNAIMVLVRQEKGAQAEEMLARLSDLLRGVLEDGEAQEVSLGRELEYLQLYLAIEEVRFQDRLRVEMAVEPEALAALVPHLGLQPLVENAIRHGIGRRSAAGHLRIQAARVNGSLQIRVEDDGPGLAQDGPAAEPGIGLANTRSRLRQLYGDAARLTLENRPAGGAVATLVLPFRLEEDVRP
ncbi:MAG TPA: hypothetical protein DD490_08440 [Acidobacteria bacterium]|nr:hypothetical protein [Acidobacteriota bacterium]